MTWTVIVARPAQKAVATFPAKDQVMIKAAVQVLALDPFAGDVIKLEGGRHRWRRRAGSYRIFFAVNANARTVEISAIVRRTSTTY
jgi:mRNA-degrading endonuclease RelE of RelBE toxin-antitoxin system